MIIILLITLLYPEAAPRVSDLIALQARLKFKWSSGFINCKITLCRLVLIIYDWFKCFVWYLRSGFQAAFDELTWRRRGLASI